MHSSLPPHAYFARDTRDQLFKTLRIHLSVEESAEALRQMLKRKPYFSVHDAFATCDVDSNGFITQKEFKGFLKKNGVYVTDGELELLL